MRKRKIKRARKEKSITIQKENTRVMRSKEQAAKNKNGVKEHLSS